MESQSKTFIPNSSETMLAASILTDKTQPTTSGNGNIKTINIVFLLLRPILDTTSSD